MKLGGNLPLSHDALLFSTSSTGSYIYAYSRTDTAGYTKEFDCPVMDLGGGGQGGQYLGVKRMRTDDVSVHSPTRVHRATETYDPDSI